ncbi:MAG TPA: general secretion pathway protein GspB [Burkholderiaceae bacterium]|nr:general secretion pathway protein GspB [Burkholderiaceae bacterium]
MSYILDALKKAESERKLGFVPNVHTAAPNAVSASNEHNSRKWLPWLLAALTLAILLPVSAWLQVWRQQAPTTPIPTANTVAATPAIVEKTASVAATPAVPQVKPESVPAATPASKPLFAKPAKATVPAQVPPPIVKSNEPAPIAAIAATPVTEPSSASPQPDENQVGTIRDLPQNIRLEIPAFVVNGYIYAKNPADRSVLINQRLLHEGDQIAPELMLEKMIPKGAILNYKGYRYRVTF